MRAMLAFIVTVALTVAPIAAAAATPCSHAPSPAPADAGHGGHAMTVSVDAHAEPAHGGVSHTTESAPGCDCDPGCADHCDGATPAALVSSVGAVPVTAVVPQAARITHRAHPNPPPGAPLRPPQTPTA